MKLPPARRSHSAPTLQMRFRPVTKRGVVVAFWTSLEVGFQNQIARKRIEAAAFAGLRPQELVLRLAHGLFFRGTAQKVVSHICVAQECLERRNTIGHLRKLFNDSFRLLVALVD